MRADVQASPDQIDMTDIVRAIFRRLPKLVTWTLAAGLVAYATLSLVAPRYESEAQIVIAARGAKLNDPKREGQTAESVAVRMDKEAVNTHVRALQSRDLAAEIAATLKLEKRVEFNAALGAEDTLSGILRLAGIGAPRPGETEQDRVLSAFFKRLEVYPAKESRVIGVRFSSSDPQLAAGIANLIVETYRTSLASRSLAETDEVQKALEPKIEALKREVADAERAVEKFRGEANIFKGGQQATGLNEQQLAELTAELSKAKAARSEAEARTKSAREMLRAGSADALPDVQKSPLIQNLVQQRVRAERQISELSATLLPGHPRMRQLKADLAGLKKQLDGEVGKIVDGLDKEAKVAALREESINRSLAEIKERIVTASPDEVKLRQLENDARSKRAELERLQTQFEANRVSDDTRTVPVEVQIITQAGVSSVPVFPKKGAFTALVMTATFLFGLVGIITRALLAGARRPSTGALVQGATYNGVERRAQPSPEPVRMADAASVSAPPVQPAAQPAVARSAARSEQQSVVDAHEPLGGAAPAAALVISAGEPQLAPKGSIGEIAARLDRAAKRGTGFRTLVTGETAGIEPGAEALSLGKMLAASGKSVIIVDWSTSGAGLAGELGIAARPGLSELIDGRATFEDIVQRVPGGEVHAIASGPSAATSTGEVDADRVNLILDALDEAYDHIIIVGPYDDAHHLFEAIEGRFDAGLLVATEERQLPAVADEASSSMFLGFEVSDIMIVRYERPPSPSQPGAVPIQRLLRATGKHAAREGATASVPAS